MEADCLYHFFSGGSCHGERVGLPPAVDFPGVRCPMDRVTVGRGPACGWGQADLDRTPSVDRQRDDYGGIPDLLAVIRDSVW